MNGWRGKSLWSLGAAATAVLLLGSLCLAEWSWAASPPRAQQVRAAESSTAPKAMGRGSTPTAQEGKRGSGLVWGLLAVTAIGAAVLAYLYLKEKDKEDPDVSLTVAVQSDNKFDVIVDGATVGTVPWASSATYAVMPSKGAHSVLLRAKEVEDTNVTVTLKLNNGSKYKFGSGSTTKGTWTQFSLTADQITGKFLFDRGLSLNTEFSFQVTIDEK